MSSTSEFDIPNTERNLVGLRFVRGVTVFFNDTVGVGSIFEVLGFAFPPVELIIGTAVLVIGI